MMHLAVFLKPPGVGEVGTVRVSIWEWAIRLGTLNSQIPSLSDMSHKRVGSVGKVASSKT